MGESDGAKAMSERSNYFSLLLIFCGVEFLDAAYDAVMGEIDVRRWSDHA